MAQKSLLVRVVEAKNLLAADKGGTSDPYCKVRVGTTIQKTKTVKRCLNPKFEETFRFRISNPQTAKVVVEVFDHDSWSKDDPLGSVSISLSSLEKGVELVKLYNLTGVPKGQVKIGLKAEDFGAAPGTQPQTTAKASSAGYQSNYANPAVQGGAAPSAGGYQSNYGTPAPGAYPQQQQQQQQGPPGAYPQQGQAMGGAPGGYPQQGPPGAYPQQGQPMGGAPGGYPQQQQQQGPPGAYPQQGQPMGGAPGGYPQQGPPGGYPAMGGAPPGYPGGAPAIPGVPTIPGAFPNYPMPPGANAYPSYPPQGQPGQPGQPQQGAYTSYPAPQ